MLQLASTFGSIKQIFVEYLPNTMKSIAVKTDKIQFLPLSNLPCKYSGWTSIVFWCHERNKNFSVDSKKKELQPLGGFQTIQGFANAKKICFHFYTCSVFKSVKSPFLLSVPFKMKIKVKFFIYWFSCEITEKFYLWCIL